MTATAKLIRLSQWWVMALAFALFFFHYGDTRVICGRGGDPPDVCETEAGMALWQPNIQSTYFSLGSEYERGLFFRGLGPPQVQLLEAVGAAALVVICVCVGSRQLWKALRGRLSEDD
jgi:hypothetical protein